MGAHRTSPSGELAQLIVNALAEDQDALARLGELLGSHPDDAGALLPPAYTVAGLAQALGVTCRVVRNAIARGELAAVKRGGRWIVAADAVAAWTQAPTPVPPRRRPPASRTRRRPLRETLARLDVA